MNRSRFVACLVLGAVLSCAAGSGAQDLPSCEQARALVVPGADDLAAETIPWRPSFRQGALEADAADRPVLLWAMNGHPLGCT